MRIRTKVVLVIVIVGLLGGLTLLSGIRHLFIENIRHHEQEMLEKDVGLAVNLVGSELSQVEKFTKDWSNWTDSYLFVYGQEREKYVEDNFSPTTFETQEINFMLFVKKDGTIVDSRWYSLGEKQFVEPRLQDVERLVRLVRYQAQKKGQDMATGMVILSDYPAMLSSQIIKDSQLDRTSDAYLVVGRFLTPEKTEKLSQYTDFEIQIGPAAEPHTGIASLSARAETRQEREITGVFSEKTIRGETFFSSPDREDTFVLHITSDRYMYHQGMRTLNGALVAFAIVASMFLLIVYLMMDRIVVSRIRKMKDEVSRIRSFEDIAASQQAGGGDEISELALGFSRVMDQLRAAHNQVTAVSRTDALTGLYNRSYFNEYSSQVSEEQLKYMGVVVCDVDGLKLTNDMLGHAAGDALLKKVAGSLKQTFGDTGEVFRFGGDEFIVLVENTTLQELECRGEALAKELADTPWIGQEKGLPIRVSLGYACSEEGHFQPIKRLIQHADMNMYKEKLLHQQSRRSGIVQTLRSALAARAYGEEHMGNVSHMIHMAYVMGRALYLERKQLIDMQLLVEFHDIGDIGIPEGILIKQEPLTKEEWQEVRRHCEIGYRIAQSTSELMPIAELILKHHEWWNGLGYPLGLKGKDIPVECRIFSIIDAWDAMTSLRPYRKTRTWEEALQELERMAGEQFDPELVALFSKLLSTGAFVEKNEQRK